MVQTHSRPRASKVNRHRVFQIGKLHFRGKQVALVAGRQFERCQAFLGRGDLELFGHVRFDLGEIAGARIVDRGRNGFAGGHGPDALVAVGGHFSQLGELGREN